MAGTYNLITVAEAKIFPGLSSLPSSEDSILESLIDAATFAFEEYWGTYGVIRGISEEKITYSQIRRDSPGANIMKLQKTPIQSVVSIADSAGNTIDSDDYWIDEYAGLRAAGGWQIPQDSNGFATYWMVTYSGGWVDETADVPANIKTACKMQVYSMYKRPDRDLVSKRVGDLALSYKSEQGDEAVAPAIKNMIARWKRVAI